tara:strand:+ start:882 stop:1127 length:246 start_codon:yes stop_codon:yes gene_type:complete
MKRLPTMWDDCLVGYELGAYHYSLSLMLHKLKVDFESSDEELCLEWLDYNVIGFISYYNNTKIIDDRSGEIDITQLYFGEN